MWVSPTTGNEIVGWGQRKINNDKMKNEHFLSACKCEKQATFSYDTWDQPSFINLVYFVCASQELTDEGLLIKRERNEYMYTKHHFLEGFLPPVAAQATSPAEERQDVTVLYSKMTLGELQSTFSLNVSVISPCCCVTKCKLVQKTYL